MTVKQKGAPAEREKRKVDYDVVLIGDVFYDIAAMPVQDYPERDKQIGCEFMLSIGGQAGNCAAACASLGLKTALICKTGGDVLSKWVISSIVASIYPADKKDCRFLNSPSLSNSNRRTLSLNHDIFRFD